MDADSDTVDRIAERCMESASLWPWLHDILAVGMAPAWMTQHSIRNRFLGSRYRPVWMSRRDDRSVACKTIGQVLKGLVYGTNTKAPDTRILWESDRMLV
jgi:hypothetical protein